MVNFHLLAAPFDRIVIGLFEFDRRTVAEGLKETSGVEPVDPFKRRELHLLVGLPGTAAFDQLALVEADDGLGEGVVVAVADRADAGRDAELGQAFGVDDRGVLPWDPRSL